MFTWLLVFYLFWRSCYLYCVTLASVDKPSTHLLSAHPALQNEDEVRVSLSTVASPHCVQINKLVSIMQNPRQYKIPDWFLNRQKDERDGKYTQLLSNALDTKLRDDLELLKKIRCHRGIRHYWGFVACLTTAPRLTCLQSPCAWTAHQDHWSPRTHCRCLQEKGRIIVFVFRAVDAPDPIHAHITTMDSAIPRTMSRPQVHHRRVGAGHFPAQMSAPDDTQQLESDVARLATMLECTCEEAAARLASCGNSIQRAIDQCFGEDARDAHSKACYCLSSCTCSCAIAHQYSPTIISTATL